MKSIYNYPKFQAIREQLEDRPLRYKQKKSQAIFRLYLWKNRHYDIKFRVMKEQKREPYSYGANLCRTWDW